MADQLRKDMRTAAPLLLLALSLLATTLVTAAYGADMERQEGVTANADPATVSTGMRERIEPIYTQDRPRAMIGGVNCGLIINRNLPDCADYWQPESREYNALPGGADVTTTHIQRGWHTVTRTDISE